MSLVDTLEPRDDREQRPRRLLERRFQRRQLADEQRSGAGDRRVLRHSMGARLGAMRGAEGVHDVDVAQRRHFLRELVGVLLLALVEAHVLEQDHRPGFHDRRRSASRA